MNEQIQREEGMHGDEWNAAHDGYFADPAVAAPLVAHVLEGARVSRPEVVVDLGGGTGFLLGRLRAAGLGPEVALINLDESSRQLDAARLAGLACRLGAVDTFTRRDLGAEDRRHLFLMRSVLHYFGQEGLRPVLRHLRAQARPGEYFIHQTACFVRPSDAALLNRLYHMMRTPKWYPTVTGLEEGLEAEGWRVLGVHPAPPLCLRSEDLRRRYHLEAADVARIRERLGGNAGVPAEVFRLTERDGFCAHLHYRIWVCRRGD